ncbi:MAG: winged helix-turn-helix transcriptional regulator [bacterium]|nr:winged helix-turn-helix transcriptional regulator [bacterium]
MPSIDFIMKPKISEITVSTEEVYNVLYSMSLINRSRDVSGLNPGIIEIRNLMDFETLRRNKLVMNGLHYSVIPAKKYQNFDSYLFGLKTLEPAFLQSRILAAYKNIYEQKYGESIDISKIILDENLYIDFIAKTFNECDVDISIEKEAFQYISTPEKLKKLLIQHLTYMWEEFFKTEWENNRILLEESVKAYKGLGIESLEKIEAARLIGFETMDSDWGQFVKKLEKVNKLYFVPSVHLGPYKGKFCNLNNDEMWLFYGSLKPEGKGNATVKLNTSDLLIQFNALADGIRLEILRLCASGDEYSSQQLLAKLNISQSAISRHLKQLSATGFLLERRENSSKFYQFNKDKVKNTINLLDGYLELTSDQFVSPKNMEGNYV